MKGQHKKSMKTISPLHSKKGFTLIEMLVVITIIVILAGISVAGFSFVTTKQANEQAKIQVSLLSQALEEYKMDHGDYPASNSDSSQLYIKLFYEGYEFSEDPNRSDPDPNNPKATRIYLADLDPRHDKQGWVDPVSAAEPPASTNIIDPWGENYIYRNPPTVNPDFDLLSKGKDGIEGTKDDITNF